MALISFLCASYNHGRYVDAFLRSVFGQSVPDWELVIVDDCSTDDNLDVIAKHPDARIRIVRHKRNEGMTKSLQDAFLASSSPVVAWVASDDMLECQYAETVLRELKDHPEADVVYTPLLYMNEDGTSTLAVRSDSQISRQPWKRVRTKPVCPVPGKCGNRHAHGHGW